MCKTVLTRTAEFLLVALLLLTGNPTASAQTDQKVSLDVKAVKLEQVMRQIEKQTNCVFLNKDVNVDQPITAVISNKPLGEALNILFKDRDIDWKIDTGHIIISRKPVETGENGRGTSVISGLVVDEEGAPVIGAGVMIKGTAIGAGTDLDGNFSFALPDGMEDSTLEISCLGYTSQELRIGSRRVFNVTLTTDAILMEGTVVTALGIRRSEKALSYNVQQIESDEVTRNKDANFINSLNGKVAGVTVNSSSAHSGKWTVTGIIILVLLILLLLAAILFFIAANFFPDLLDHVLYNREELEIINYWK